MHMDVLSCTAQGKVGTLSVLVLVSIAPTKKDAGISSEEPKIKVMVVPVSKFHGVRKCAYNLQLHRQSASLVVLLKEMSLDIELYD
jgi:hypothetical protein